MSRYIDAEFEIAHYTSMTTHPTPDVTEQDKRNSLIILNALRMARSIDICFCRECKWGKPYSDKQLECDALGLGGLKFPDDFCSYGVKRSEKPNNCEDFFREPTAEERKAVADYIGSISVPTGVNIFDLMDESQTERNE